MQGKYPVVTLCGSTRFKDEFYEAQKRLTLEGNIVISVGLFCADLFNLPISFFCIPIVNKSPEACSYVSGLLFRVFSL